MTTLDAARRGGAVLCDVWHVGGDFPTLDRLLPGPRPASPRRPSPAPSRSGSAPTLLLPDDTLNPTRYVLAEPDGTLRPVHVDEVETDDGTERRPRAPVHRRRPGLRRAARLRPFAVEAGADAGATRARPRRTTLVNCHDYRDCRAPPAPTTCARTAAR